MEFVDLIVVGIILAVLGLAGWYVYRAKKRGQKCIGCPHSSQCAASCNGCSQSDEKE